MEFLIEPRPYDDPDALRMVADVQAEYVVRYGTPDESAIGPDEFVAPDGVFLVGVLDGVAVATGGWRRIAADEAEVKRMYVAPAARRQGLSLLMLAAIEGSAAEAGVTRMILMTGQAQPEAVALYEQCGYRPIAGFGHYAQHELALFYAKALAVQTVSRG